MPGVLLFLLLAQDSFVLRGGTVHTISGPVIENGTIIVRNGRIVGVGHDLAAPEGAKIIDVKGQHVYPGMIDSASMVGTDPANEQIPAARSNGVTSVVEVPEGDLLAGQLSVVHMNSATAEGMTVAAATAIYLRFPAIVTRPIAPHEPADDDDEPTTAVEHAPVPYSVAKKDHDAKLRELNRFFDQARRYRNAKLAKARNWKTDPRYEAMIPVLEGATPMFVTAVREREIREAVAFADKQKIRIILADAYEAYKVVPLIKSHSIPVVLGPTLSLPIDEDDPYDRSFTTPAELYQAGIRFSIATFSSRSTRNLPYQAAAAAAYGLPHDEAYKAVSLYPAEIFGLGKRLGSIDEGKLADLIVTDGDPMEARTHVSWVFIDGKPMNLETRQKQLYEKYIARP